MDNDHSSINDNEGEDDNHLAHLDHAAERAVAAVERSARSTLSQQDQQRCAAWMDLLQQRPRTQSQVESWVRNVVTVSDDPALRAKLDGIVAPHASADGDDGNARSDLFSRAVITAAASAFADRSSMRDDDSTANDVHDRDHDQDSDDGKPETSESKKQSVQAQLETAIERHYHEHNNNVDGRQKIQFPKDDPISLSSYRRHDDVRISHHNMVPTVQPPSILRKVAEEDDAYNRNRWIHFENDDGQDDFEFDEDYGDVRSVGIAKWSRGNDTDGAGIIKNDTSDIDPRMAIVLRTVQSLSIDKQRRCAEWIALLNQRPTLEGGAQGRTMMEDWIRRIMEVSDDPRLVQALRSISVATSSSEEVVSASNNNGDNDDDDELIGYTVLTSSIRAIADPPRSSSDMRTRQQQDITMTSRRQRRRISFHPQIRQEINDLPLRPPPPPPSLLDQPTERPISSLERGCVDDDAPADDTSSSSSVSLPSSIASYY